MNTAPDIVRILLIDDNRSIHEDFRKVLCDEARGGRDLAAAEEALFGDEPDRATASGRYAVDSAFQGQEGLELVRQGVAGGARYATAFVDVRMPPGWDGVETTARIWEVDPDLQIVICTAYSDYSWDDMLRRLKHSDRLVILKKPFDNIEVLQLANCLSRKWQLLQDSKTRLSDLEKMVAARTAEVVREQAKFRAIFEQSPEGIFQTSLDGRLLSANSALARIYGCASPAELVGQLTDVQAQLYADHARRDELTRRLEGDEVVRDFEAEIVARDGARKWINITALKVPAADDSPAYYQGFVFDITAQKQARHERELMEIHLRQAQKLESVGQLAAGIAHEINTPIQYIGDNIRFVADSFPHLARLAGAYEEMLAVLKADAVTPELIARFESRGRDGDPAYLTAEIPNAIHQSLEGVDRIARIVRAMKEFSHPANAEKSPTNLNHAIDTVITVARNEWKYVAEVVTDFAPDLPLVPCLPGDFNQVILNLIVNSAHAIGDVVQGAEGVRGTIHISTRRDGSSVEVRVRDTGTGIPEAIRARIFEPFFTTKTVGKGTGQGLAMARSIIVKKHGGELKFESTAGQGTTFIIRLPL